MAKSNDIGPQTVRPSKAELQEALQALGIDVPYYSAHRGRDGSILIVTRNGAQVYKTPSKTRRKA